MPALPWTTAAARASDPDQPVLVLASRLELRSYREVVRFLRAATRIRTQVRGSNGAYGLALDAQPLRKTFWTLSAWTDQTAMDAFVRTAPHVDVMQKFGSRLKDSGFETFSIAARELPRARGNARELWQAGRERLGAATKGDNR
jgi:hypothetical protein